MKISVRIRQDFLVTDADRLLTAARRIHRDLNPGMSADDAQVTVTCAADAVFVILEHAGMIGDALDDRLAEYARNGLDAGEYRAQVVPNEPSTLSSSPRGDCLRTADVFALPPDVDAD